MKNKVNSDIVNSQVDNISQNDNIFNALDNVSNASQNNDDIILQNQFDYFNFDVQIDVAKAQRLLQCLNQDPPPHLIKTNKFANNTKYLPISFLEMLLDQYTLGMWETYDFIYQVIANELTGTINLKYFNPVVGRYFNRVGAAAVQIQTRAGMQISFENKIPNTLTKQVAQLKAECFRNAVKSLGKLFGRDLNRDDEAEYTPAYSADDDSVVLQLNNKIKENIKMINEIKNIKRGSDEF